MAKRCNNYNGIVRNWLYLEVFMHTQHFFEGKVSLIHFTGLEKTIKVKQHIVWTIMRKQSILLYDVTCLLFDDRPRT
jgi:hypothetical protein